MTPNMRLEALHRALTQDLDGWRSLTSDHSQFESFTQTAIDWQQQGRSTLELTTLLAHSVETIQAVRTLGRAAKQVASLRLGPKQCSDSSLLGELVKYTDHLLAALDEVTTLYDAAPGTLQSYHKDGMMLWQM